MDLKQYKNWFIGGLIILAGLLLLIGSKFCIKVMVIAMGVGAVVDGVYSLINEKNIFEDKVFQTSIMVKSIVSIVIGVMAVIFPLAIAGAAWGVMTYLLAIFLVVSAVCGFFASSKLKDMDVDRKQLIRENSICLLAAVLLFLIGPEKLGIAIVRIAGFVAILAGVIYIVFQIREKKSIIVVNAEVKDETPSVSDEE